MSNTRTTVKKMVKNHGKALKKSKLGPSKAAKKTQAKKKSNAPQGKVVGATELNWKKVDIPDTLDDYGGFYGLEEIDGVDVKVVDGKVQFIARDETAVKSKDDEAKSEPENEEPAQEQDQTNEEAEQEQEQEQEQEHKSEEEEQESDDEEQDQDENQELKPNVFNSELNLEDFSSPELPEWQKIAPLSFTVLNGLSQQGFTKPTDIQKEVLPLALKNEDIMGKAATGSGKTLAYGIPLLESLVHEPDHSKSIGLIFTPTRELAQQVTQHLKKLGQLIIQKSKFAILPLTGGLSIQKQERILKYENSARIVVATPGRFLELIEKNIDLIPRFARINTLVLDEADRLLQDGHFDEFEKILKLLGGARKSFDKTGWQTMIFSATFSLSLFSKLATASWKSLKKDEDEMEQVLKHLMQKIRFKSKPVIVDTNSEEKIKSQIRESLIECGPMERDLYSYYFLAMYPGTTLIFCNSIDSVKKLCAYFNNLKIDAFQIHSSMTQKNRLRSLERYLQKSAQNDSQNKATVLVASDVAARGLDIPGIKHVVHYHLPRTADTYIHRSGRTARADNEGVSVMICSPEEAMGPLRKLRKMLADKSAEDEYTKHKKWQKEVPLLPIELDIVNELKERGSLASELAEHQLALTSINKQDNWMQKAAEDLGIDIDSDEEFMDSNKSKKQKKTMGKVEAKQARAYLNQLLSRPIRKDRRQKYLTGGFVNLADNIVKKRGHESIIGHDKVDALETLKSKKRRK
ncbi:hypothetical protein ZYGR_0H00810 [Zygosaccharomyces rouxii]|uniref:RNA helicase n=1 Tax=Zygosaccharomyces rouxii TaxID=4956 RepID=A0A1Q2ZUR2_ZYGRO|nr:hypothetical protein ZYGR_0H00810 [Zygosaccharomyces rouxii]